MRALTTRLASSLAAPRALPRIDPSLVSAADGARFNEDGAIVVRGVVGPEWLDALRGLGFAWPPDIIDSTGLTPPPRFLRVSFTCSVALTL